MSERGLSRCLNVPDGIKLDEACARADRNLARLAPRAIEDVLENVRAIADLASRFEAVPPAARVEMHALSCAVAGLAGSFGREALSKVAYSLCRLIDETEPGWSTEATALHVQAMRHLCMPQGASAETQEKIVEGLVKVRRRLAEERKGLPPTR